MTPAKRPILPVAEDARFSRHQAAEYIGVSVAFLASDVVTGAHKIPHFKIGRRVIYLKSQLDAWMSARVVNVPARV